MNNNISKFIFPPHFNYKTKYIPLTINTKTFKVKKGTEISREDKYWSKLYKKIDDLYDVKPAILPKGTTLYRCSIYTSPTKFGKSKLGSSLMYFGLDVAISIWLALEIKDRNKDVQCYLHVYELQEDIEYKYIADDRGTIPEINIESCGKMPCIHPQRILHGDTDVDKYNELGTELTFSRSFNVKKLVKPIRTFRINANMLANNREKFIFEWNPVRALADLRRTRRHAHQVRKTRKVRRM